MPNEHAPHPETPAEAMVGRFVRMEASPARETCAVCLGEIVPTTWRAVIRAGAGSGPVMHAHEGCLMRAVDGRWGGGAAAQTRSGCSSQIAPARIGSHEEESE